MCSTRVKHWRNCQRGACLPAHDLTPTPPRPSTVQVPIIVSDLDLEGHMWLKIRLAPMCPYIGTLQLAFVEPPAIKVQISPYNRVRLMRIPVV